MKETVYYQYRLEPNLPDLTNQPNTYGLYQKKIQHVIREKNLTLIGLKLYCSILKINYFYWTVEW